MSTSLGEAVVEVGADTANFRKDVDQGVNAALKNSAKSVQNLGRSMTNVGKTLTLGVTAPIVGIGIASVKVAGQFETSMNMLQAAGGVSGKALEGLRAQAIKLGADTVFSANESADAMLELGRAGFNAAQISKAVPQVLNLAATEGLGLAQSAGIVTSALAQFSLKAGQSGQVVNALAGASNASKASVASISEALVYAGGAAANAGLSVQETAAALAALSQQGLEGSVAGTSLAGVLGRLIPQTDAAKTAMKDLNINFVNANGSFKSISQIAGILQDKFGGMTEAAKQVKLRAIFGRDASTIQAVNALINQGASGLVKLTKASSNQSAASKLAAARMKGVQGALEQMKGALETAGLVIGSALIPVVKAAAKGIAFLAGVFGKLPKPILTIILVMAGIAAAIGPVLVIIGSLVAAIGAISAASAPLLLTFGAVAGGVALVIAALVGLTLGFKSAWANSELFRVFIVKSFDGVIQIVRLALGAFQLLFAALGHVPGFGWATTAAEAIGKARDSLQGLSDKVKASSEHVKTLGKVTRDTTAEMSLEFVTMALGAGKVAQAFSRLPRAIKLQFSSNVPTTTKEVANLASEIKNVKPAQIKAIIDASGVKTSVAKVQAEITKQKMNVNLGANPKSLQKTLAASGLQITRTEAKAILGLNDTPFTEVLISAASRANKIRPKPKLDLDRTVADTIINKFVKDAGKKKPTVKIDADDSEARSKLAKLVADAAAQNIGALFSFGSAAGSKVPKGFAGGGIVPGNSPADPRRDNVLAMSTRGNPLMVRSGEWIINEKASRDNDRLLAAINGGARFKQVSPDGGGGASSVAVQEGDTNITNINNFNGPASLSEAQRRNNWSNKYGTRFGSATDGSGL